MVDLLALCLWILLLNEASAQGNTDCLLRDYGENSKVCVCNSEHCDYFTPVITPGKVNIFTSSRQGARFLKSTQEISKSPSSSNVATIDKSQKYQRILGWGGALTDSTGINLKSLPQAAADHLMRSYFSKDGSRYNLCRVPMGGTDFSTHGYSYNDGPEDKNLTNFKLAQEDFEYKMPLMKQALNLSNEYTQLKFLTSTWTAPKWMKSNGEYYGWGEIKKEFYQTWADYFLKFLEAYKSYGFDFWGVTTGNEPLLARLPFVKINSIAWTPSTQSLWTRENLGPTLRNSNFSNIKIMAIDDQRFFFPDYAKLYMQNAETRNYIDGFSVHWYADSIISAKVLSETHENFPDKFILSMEASNGFLPFDTHVEIGSWKRGDLYAHDIIMDLNNWVVAWVDWNMALDTNGGPTYIKNFIDSAILVNATAAEFYKQPMYYAIGHFSKFIPEGSVRIGLTSNFKHISMVALERPNNDTVLVILNRGNSLTSISIKGGEESFINLELEQYSITTVIY